MCLIIRKNAKVKTAEKDIVCYKVVEKGAKSGYATPFFNMPISIGEEYGDVSLEKKDNIHGIVVEEGYHSLKTFEDAADYTAMLMLLHQFHHFTIVKCVIPKGAKYYDGRTTIKFGELHNGYASDKIRYVEVVYEDREKDYSIIKWV